MTLAAPLSWSHLHFRVHIAPTPGLSSGLCPRADAAPTHQHRDLGPSRSFLSCPRPRMVPHFSGWAVRARDSLGKAASGLVLGPSQERTGKRDFWTLSPEWSCVSLGGAGRWTVSAPSSCLCQHPSPGSASWRPRMKALSKLSLGPTCPAGDPVSLWGGDLPGVSHQPLPPDGRR